MKRVIRMSNPNYPTTAPYGVQAYMPQTGFNSPQYDGANLSGWYNQANRAITGLGEASLYFGQAATSAGSAATKFGTSIQKYGYTNEK